MMHTTTPCQRTEAVRINVHLCLTPQCVAASGRNAVGTVNPSIEKGLRLALTFVPVPIRQNFSWCRFCRPWLVASCDDQPAEGSPTTARAVARTQTVTWQSVPILWGKCAARVTRLSWVTPFQSKAKQQTSQQSATGGRASLKLLLRFYRKSSHHPTAGCKTT